MDHYLPKAKFPQLSVVAQNLVPSCRDCNLGGKGSGVAVSAEQQPIHPYYDAVEFNREQWLFGEVVETSPATIRFFASPPREWSNTEKGRVLAHLISFDLSARFSFQAAEELSHIRQVFLNYYNGSSSRERMDYLSQKEIAESQLHPNSWKRAMYQALGNSHWYCNGGYQ